MMHENRPHLRVVDEKLVKHEDQLAFLCFVARDLESSDELVEHVLMSTVIANQDELKQAIEIVAAERPGLIKAMSEKVSG